MIRRIAVLGMLLAFSCQMSFAQQTIDEQFQEFYKNETSSWQEFKLVKVPRLQEFWKVASDTVRVKREEIVSLKSQIVTLDSKIASLQSKLSETEQMLAESEKLNDNISFVGIPMSKSAYNIMVWIIIAGLIVAVVVIYLMYVRSNRVTADSRSALESLDQELKDHKDRARETQVKLKRELQTALNTIHENRLNH